MNRLLKCFCCRFKKAVEKGEIDEQEQKRAHARQSLERYMHYWQRWAENDSSRKKVGEGRGREVVGAAHRQPLGGQPERGKTWHNLLLSAQSSLVS